MYCGFGYCGFGRQPGKDYAGTFREHWRAALAAREHWRAALAAREHWRAALAAREHRRAATHEQATSRPRVGRD